MERQIVFADNGKPVPEDMMKYFKCRKRPVMVEAFQAAEPMLIQTLEGTMRAEKGDWVIRGVEGEFYPCKPGIFLKTYDILYPRLKR